MSIAYECNPQVSKKVDNDRYSLSFSKFYATIKSKSPSRNYGDRFDKRDIQEDEKKTD